MDRMAINLFPGDKIDLGLYHRYAEVVDTTADGDEIIVDVREVDTRANAETRRQYRYHWKELVNIHQW